MAAVPSEVTVRDVIFMKMTTETKPILKKWQPQIPNVKPIFILQKIQIFNQVLEDRSHNADKIPRNLGQKYQIPIWYWYFLGRYPKFLVTDGHH